LGRRIEDTLLLLRRQRTKERTDHNLRREIAKIEKENQQTHRHRHHHSTLRQSPGISCCRPSRSFSIDSISFCPVRNAKISPRLPFSLK
jgi:hypothetical protein